ncbi:hypothetical protein Lalb_Chr05g0223971 [Lupinus albus]|uniref:Uncharacterized protein n=1 Tax=Lupinus albus TaxID=3870 RepID=A0A6A4QIR5_LUPAL|nr:hypothetical protein Lalb_Chr05g0223971 [Lupinus albus]
MVSNASPISHFKLPEKPSLDYLKIKNPRSPGATPNCRKRTIELERMYSINWDIEATQRSRGSWDKNYHHKVFDITCRSLEEVERFERGEKGPVKRRKCKNNENIGEASKELASNQVEENIPIELSSIVTHEMFLADAHKNMLNRFAD